MSTFHRKASAHAVLGTFAILGMHSGNAAEPSKPAEDEGNLSCQPQIQRIAVWPHGPRKRVLEVPRYETRVRFVCKGAEKESGPKHVASAPPFGPHSR